MLLLLLLTDWIDDPRAVWLAGWLRRSFLIKYGFSIGGFVVVVRAINYIIIATTPTPPTMCGRFAEAGDPRGVSIIHIYSYFSHPSIWTVTWLDDATSDLYTTQLLKGNAWAIRGIRLSVLFCHLSGKEASPKDAGCAGNSRCRRTFLSWTVDVAVDNNYVMIVR